MTLRSIDSDPYSSDTFERDDEDLDPGSSSRLSDVGRSLMQIGLDDSIDLDQAGQAGFSNARKGESIDRGDPLRVSHELPGGSQLVHMSATLSGVMMMGEVKIKQNAKYYSRK